MAINDKLSVTIDNKFANIALDQPFTTQVITTYITKGSPVVVDMLDQSREEKGVSLVIKKPTLSEIAEVANEFKVFPKESTGQFKDKTNIK